MTRTAPSPTDRAEPGSLTAADEGPRLGSLCTGYGGLDQAALTVIPGRLVWVADSDPHVARILAHRHPKVPNLGDLRSIDWHQLAATAPIEILTAGFPCQDISDAGPRGGIAHGTRSGLWHNVMEAVRVLRPRMLIVENVAALRRRGLDIVTADLVTAGYDTQWTSVRASDAGAPHRRSRIFLAAWPRASREDQRH